MNQDQINEDLRTRSTSESPLQAKLLDLGKRYLKSSSDRMQAYWPNWEANEYLYRGYRFTDQEDRDAKKKQEPVKILVPMVYAQLQTFTSFVLSTFTQRDYFFELKGIGPEDQRYKDGLEIDLQYQVDKQKFLFLLYNWIIQSGKYGFGVTKTQWVKRHEVVRTRTPVLPTMLQSFYSKVTGSKPEQTYIEQTMKLLAYEGNEIINVSPYSFFPDPDLPLAQFQDGSFVAHEEITSLAKVRGLEGTLYHGSNKIPDKMTDDLVKFRPRRMQTADSATALLTGPENNNTVVISEILIRVIPSDWKNKEHLKNVDLPSNEPMLYVLTIANDQKVIRFEPYGYLHNKFGYALIEYSPDSDSFINPGLTDTIYELQNLMTWFLNSHVVNVRKAIKNRFIGNAEKVHTEDIESDSMIIRTRNTPDVDRVLRQLNVTDVTANHVRDMEVLNKLIQLVTGINDNAVGQYAPGRRSAYESKQVNAGAAARLKMHAQLMFMQGIEPLGRMLLANTRQGRSREVYEQIVGEKAIDCPFDQTILADPGRIIGGYDFVPYDATLPSERLAQASIFKELLSIVASNPESMQVFNKNPEAILNHIMQLLGIRNIEDFNLVQQQLPNGIETQAVGQAELDQALSQGNAVPTDLLSVLSGGQQ